MRWITLLILILTLPGCISIKLPKNYFDSQKKIGIVCNLNDIDVYKASPDIDLSLITSVLVDGRKYKDAFTVVDSTINAKSKFLNFYTGIFKSKGKKLQEVADSIDLNTYPKYIDPNNSGDYFKYDLRTLKSKYAIDELLVVEVNYGLFVTFDEGWVGRFGYCKIISQSIDLKTNKVIYRNRTVSREHRIKGNWNQPPDFKNLKLGINRAILDVMSKEIIKFK